MAPPDRTRDQASISQQVVPPEQIGFTFPSNPDDALKQLLDKLFALIMKDGNTTAAKILLDVLDKRFDETHPVFTVEDALKLLQEHCGGHV